MQHYFIVFFIIIIFFLHCSTVHQKILPIFPSPRNSMPQYFIDLSPVNCMLDLGISRKSEFLYPAQAINLHVLSGPFKPGVFCYSLKIVMLVATLHSWQLYRTITWKLPCTFWISLRTIKVFNWTVFFLLITCIFSIVIILLFTSHLMMEARGPQNILL